MSTCDSLPPLTSSANEERSSTCKSFAPSSGASHSFESARESAVWDSPFNESDFDAVSFLNNVGGEEETRASTLTSDDTSPNLFSIKPPVVAKPRSRRPWVGLGSSSTQAADVAGGPPTTTDTSSAHDSDGDGDSFVAAKPRHHLRAAWAADGSARPSAPPEMGSSRSVSKERNTLGLEAGPGRTDVRLKAEEVNHEMLKLDFSQSRDASDRPRSAARSRAQSDRRQGKNASRASRFISDPGQTTSAKEEATQSFDVQRRLLANRFGSFSSRSGVIGELPIQRASFDVPQSQQVGSPKRSESASSPKSDSSNPKLEPQTPRLVVINREDAKGSARTYNRVQFTATPSLSSSCDKKSHSLTPRAPKAKAAAIPETEKRKGLLDPESATDEVLRMFRGWSKRDVKEMLQRTYSPEEIAEVLEILSMKERRKPKSNQSKKASGE